MKYLLYLITALTLVNNSVAQTVVQPRMLEKTVTLTKALTADDDMAGKGGGLR